MEEIQEIITMYNMSNVPATNSDENYSVKFNDGNTKLVFYDKQLITDINTIVIKITNRKHSTTGSNEEILQTVPVVDPVPAIVEIPVVEDGRETSVEYGDPTYMRNAYGDLVRIN